MNKVLMIAFVMSLSFISFGQNDLKEEGFCRISTDRNSEGIFVNNIVFATTVKESKGVTLNLADLDKELKGSLTLSPALHFENALNEIVRLTVLDITVKLDKGNNVTDYISSRIKSQVVRPRGHIPLSTELFISKLSNDQFLQAVRFEIECFVE